jgi:hypothetical protein
MHGSLLLVRLLGLLVLAAGPASVPELEISWDVDRSAASLGDTVSVVLRVSWAGERNLYRLSPPSPEVGQHFTQGPTRTIQRLGGGRTEWVFTYRFVPVRAGDVSIPALKLRYLRAGTEFWEEALSPETRVRVAEAPTSFSGHLWLAAVLLGAAALATILVVLRRHHAKPPGPALDAAALRALKRVRALSTYREHTGFCQQASSIVRDYLEESLGAVLRGKATGEVLRELRGALPDGMLQSVREVLEECDRGRFGGLGDADARQRILDGCTRIFTGEHGDEH